MAIALSEIIARVPPDTADRVERQCKRVNRTLRDAIRKQTGLMLNRSSHGEREVSRSDSITVPVTVVPGLPEGLQTFEFTDDEWLVTVLSRYYRHLHGAAEILPDVRDMCRELSEQEAGQRLLAGRESTIDDTITLTREFLARLEGYDPIRRILAVNEDVLGVYRYKINRRPNSNERWSAEIELYWGVIGFVAGSLDITVESLTTVVLAHELAHAYTHMGADIDGERWSSLAFSNVQHELREGLAQYYTCIVCRDFSEGDNETLQAYEKLLDRQPPAYKVHEPWVEDCTPEAVRLAMLEARRGEITRFDVFDDLLTNANGRLRARFS